jgi:hypothetical protein
VRCIEQDVHTTRVSQRDIEAHIRLQLHKSCSQPTNIVAAGKMWLEKMWKETPAEARDEYEEYVNRFYNYNAAQPGDPPSFIAEAMEEAMCAGRPELGYKVRSAVQKRVIIVTAAAHQPVSVRDRC